MFQMLQRIHSFIQPGGLEVLARLNFILNEMVAVIRRFSAGPGSYGVPSPPSSRGALSAYS